MHVYTILLNFIHMKRLVFVLVCLLIVLQSFAHGHHEGPVKLKTWNINEGKSSIVGSFLMLKNGEIYIEDEKSAVVHFPINVLTEADQEFALAKYSRIKELSSLNNPQETNSFKEVLDEALFIISFFICLIFALLVLFNQQSRKRTYYVPFASMVLLCLFFGFSMRAQKMLKTTSNPLAIDSSFAPFKPAVYTRWDNNYFYVESKGIPAHQMMLGIRSWQQQVPLPQCYVNNNPWSIPLNPIIATNPVPVNQQHFLRGAIAVAVNGVAIFNPYTNTGVDAFLDGQLDSFGGHCGRADDYHYHTAPLVLYNQTAVTKPIAYSLDGFAVYGPKEPDGRDMLTLDNNHGHFFAGVYHYHGTNSAPYMIGNMVGQVTEDTTLQIIPQASAKGVRPALTPLKGAFINSCIPKSSGNGYVLNYTLNNQAYAVDYYWNTSGNYTYNFISPSGTTTSNYNGFVQCSLPTTGINKEVSNSGLLIYPNPTQKEVFIQFENEELEKQVLSISLFDMKGSLITSQDGFANRMDLSNIKSGQYLIQLKMKKQLISRMVLIN